MIKIIRKIDFVGVADGLEVYFKVEHCVKYFNFS